jgi:predicted small secreted protein
MPHRRRHLVLLVLVVASSVLTACGGSSGGGTDTSQLLRETFSNSKKLKSATVDVRARVDATGVSGATGPLTLRLTGPYESQGTGKLPRFSFDASLDAGGQSFAAGATWTGEKAFIAFQGVQYAVPDDVAHQFVAGYEQATRSRQGSAGLNLATLGIDPTKWLEDARNEGDAKVGDADTIKITGRANVAKVLDDVNRILERARSAGVPGTGNVPQQLTAQQKQQVQRAVRSLDVQIYTGKRDRLLRRMVLAADVKDPNSAQGAKVRLDITYTKVNEDQAIAAPSGAKPFSELLKKVGALKNSLGGLAGGSSSSGSGSAPSKDNLKKFSQCVQRAGNDTAKQRKCADLLTP